MPSIIGPRPAAREAATLGKPYVETAVLMTWPSPRRQVTAIHVALRSPAAQPEGPAPFIDADGVKVKAGKSTGRFTVVSCDHTLGV